MRVTGTNGCNERRMNANEERDNLQETKKERGWRDNIEATESEERIILLDVKLTSGEKEWSRTRKLPIYTLTVASTIDLSETRRSYM